MDYLVYRLIAPIIVGFLMLSIVISTKYIKERIAKLILAYQVSVICYLICNYLEFISNSESDIVFFAKLGHLFLELLSLFWFLFAINYTGYEKLINKKIIYLFFIIIFCNMVIIQTTDIHKLFYLNYNFVSKSGYTILQAEYGILFWVFISFSYVLLIAGVAFIITSYIRGKSNFESQAILILIGFILPLITNIIYIFRIIPGLDKDYSPAAFGLTGLFIFISINRFKLLHFTPLARNIILHDLQNSIITLDSSYKVIDFNEEASSIFNLNNNQLGLFVSETSAGEFIGNIDSYIESGIECSFVKELLDNIYEVHIKKISTSTGMVRGVIINISDITDKMNLIEKLELSNIKMKDLQEQFVQQEKMAALGSLSSGLAHEINNPLSFVKSNIGLIERTLKEILVALNSSDNKDKSKDIIAKLVYAQDLVSDSNEGAFRISEVVHNLLNYSRENKVYKTVDYDINNGVKSTLVLARNKYKYKAEIILELGEVNTFLTSGNEVNQVLLNLVTNAAQSIEKNQKGAYIKIRTLNENSNIVCEVSDNGNPIPDSELNTIFEPFYTTKEEQDGTGIGLSISRSIIENEFSGKLFVKESPEKTFRLEIPYK